MQWEGLSGWGGLLEMSGWGGLLEMSGWNGLLGVWGLEPEWTVRDSGEAAWGRQQERALGIWGQGIRDGGDAQSRSRTLGIGRGRSGSKRGCLERTRGKLFDGPFEKCAKLMERCERHDG